MDTSEWVDAPTGPGLWWRCVGATAPVLCRVIGDSAGLSAGRVDGLEMLYLATPFAGVKWRRDVPVSADETTRLRALLERAALPACEAAYDEDTGAWTVYPLPREQGVTVAEVAWSQAFCEDGVTAARGRLFAAIPTALPGLLDAAERAERERNSLRAHLDTVADAYRALLAGQPVPEYNGPVLSERGRAALDRLRPRRDVPASADEAERVRAMDLVTDAWRLMSERALRAERERDDLAATLETHNAEHALAIARVAEMEAIIAGRTTPTTDDGDGDGDGDGGETPAEIVARLRRYAKEARRCAAWEHSQGMHLAAENSCRDARDFDAQADRMANAEVTRG